MVQWGHGWEHSGAQPEASSSPRAPRLLSPGVRLGPFTLLGPLGAGGAGYVWTAVQSGALGFTQRTALKLLRPERWSNARARERFESEARIGAALRHPNVRGVHDVGEVEGCPYMSLRWVDTSLAELLEQAPGHKLEPSIAAFIAIQCCAALEAAHGWSSEGRAQPVLHGDLSPDNILLTQDGHVLVADFAGADVDAAATPSSSPGEPRPPHAPPLRAAFFGKLGYAAPEALRESGRDARADLFSLGCVLYQMLAGRPPFASEPGEDEHALTLRVLGNRATELRALAPSTPPELAQIVRTCMQGDRQARFPDAAALRRALCRTLRRSDFDLEESTSELMRATLGARLDQREAELFRSFERLNTQPGQHTETLPLGPPLARDSAAPQREPAPPAPPTSRTLSEIGGRAQTERPPEAPRGAARTRPPPRSRVLWVIAVLGALAPALYALSQRPSTPSATAPPPISAAAPQPNPTPANAAPPAEDQRQLEPQPQLRPQLEPQLQPQPQLEPQPPRRLQPQHQPQLEPQPSRRPQPSSRSPSTASAPSPTPTAPAPTPVRGIDDSNPY